MVYVNDVTLERRMDKKKNIESADPKFLLIMDFLRRIYRFFLIYTTSDAEFRMSARRGVRKPDQL